MHVCSLSADEEAMDLEGLDSEGHGSEDMPDSEDTSDMSDDHDADDDAQQLSGGSSGGEGEPRPASTDSPSRVSALDSNSRLVRLSQHVQYRCDGLIERLWSCT